MVLHPGSLDQRPGEGMVIAQILGVGCSLGRRSLGWGFCYLSWS